MRAPTMSGFLGNLPDTAIAIDTVTALHRARLRRTKERPARPERTARPANVRRSAAGAVKESAPEPAPTRLGRLRGWLGRERAPQTEAREHETRTWPRRLARRGLELGV